MLSCFLLMWHLPGVAQLFKAAFGDHVLHLQIRSACPGRKGSCRIVRQRLYPITVYGLPSTPSLFFYYYGDWTWGFSLARQVLYRPGHVSRTLPLFYFQAEPYANFAWVGPKQWSSYLHLSSHWDFRRELPCLVFQHLSAPFLLFLKVLLKHILNTIKSNYFDSTIQLIFLVVYRIYVVIAISSFRTFSSHPVEVHPAPRLREPPVCVLSLWFAFSGYFIKIRSESVVACVWFICLAVHPCLKCMGNLLLIFKFVC
jgi:hypothetical protein